MVSNSRSHKKIKQLPAIIFQKNLCRNFTEIGPTVVKKVDSSIVTFDKYLEVYNITQPESNLKLNELKDAFFSLKLNKSQGKNHEIIKKNMYNCLYKHLSDNNILCRKRFGFQENHLTEHAIMQLADQINCSFEKPSLYTLGIFIFDVSKTIFQNHFSMMSQIFTCYKNVQLKKKQEKKKKKNTIRMKMDIFAIFWSQRKGTLRE